MKTNKQRREESKWWSLRVIAIETMGCWGKPEHITQLEAFAAVRAGRGSWKRAAADAAQKALLLRQQTP